MKKFLITALLLSQQLRAYDIYVMNDTVKSVKVRINKINGKCKEPNHGDILPAKTEDHWPTNSNCETQLIFFYPDNTTGEVTAYSDSHHFVITSRVAKDSAGRPIKNENGEDKIIYNWEDR